MCVIRGTFKFLQKCWELVFYYVSAGWGYIAVHVPHHGQQRGACAVLWDAVEAFDQSVKTPKNAPKQTPKKYIFLHFRALRSRTFYDFCVFS